MSLAYATCEGIFLPSTSQYDPLAPT